MISYLENLFFFSLLLTQLPPLYIQSQALNTHLLAKLILGFVFISSICKQRFKLALFKEHKVIIPLYIGYFISQSISIIRAINIEAFIARYEDLFFSSLVFLLLFIYLNNQKQMRKIVFILFVSLIVNLSFQALIYFYPNLFIQLGNIFIHPKEMDLIIFNIQRGRIFFDSYNEIILPIIVLCFINNIYRKSQFFLIALFIFTVFFSFASNIRTNFVICILSVASIVILILRKAKIMTLIVVSIFFLIFLSYKLQSVIIGFSVIERLLLEDRIEDYSVIINRLQRWQKAIDIGFTSPTFGIGLGNFPEYMGELDKKNKSLFPFRDKIYALMNQYPYNIFLSIFAETGFLGITFYTLLILYFVLQDMVKFREMGSANKIFTVSFWLLFLYSLFNPAYIIKYLTLFWIIRQMSLVVRKNFISR
jgi:O-antigen ligase